MLTINTNLSSLIAQNSMKTSTSRLNQAIERMTTGFKINHASDNAANYSISTNMTTKIGAYNVAEDNAAMGLDLINTAEGTLDQIQDKLQRLRALQEQASNGTYGEESLNAINSEANALVDEINRLYSTAEYNGQKLFGSEEASPAVATFGMARSGASSGYIQQITRRNTSGMTTLASVDGSADLADGVYSISTKDELAKLATMTDAGLITAGDEFVLANDIDLSSYSNWTPIGVSEAFVGVFDGNGYVISNLTCNSEFAGLFGQVFEGSIKNLGLEDVNVSSSSSSGIAGGLVAMLANGATITNCYATGSISSQGGIAGGLVGAGGGNGSDTVHPTLNACWVDVEVTCSNGDGSSDDVYGNAGGLVGTTVYSGININNSYAKGTVSATDCAGGLVGWVHFEPAIKNSYSLCEVSGGLVTTALFYCDQAVDAADVSNCYYIGAEVPTPISASTNSATATSKTRAQLETMLPTLQVATGNDSPAGGTGGAGGGVTAPAYAPGTILLQIGTSSDWASQVGVSTKFSLTGVDDLRMIGLDTTTDYLSQIDDMLEVVAEKQTHFGAASNRLESVLEEITIQRDNLVSSRSTIRDADIAEVSATYIQQQILQQASATLLATANQSPSIALQLI